MSTVWIVDDDRGVRVVLSAAMRDAGLSPREFADADTVTEALATEAPDVMFTDVRMPGTSGLELLGRLSASAAFPIIVMSAFTDVSTTAAAYRQGAFDYLPKPFDLDTAVAMAERALAQSAHETLEPARPGAIAATDLIGNSPGMRELFRAIGRVAASEPSSSISSSVQSAVSPVSSVVATDPARSRPRLVAPSSRISGL